MKRRRSFAWEYAAVVFTAVVVAVLYIWAVLEVVYR